MITLHTVGILAATAALAGGIAELGRWLGGASPLARWVRGWTALWWLIAVAAQVIDPAVAAVAGSLLVIAAFAAWGYRERHVARPWLLGSAALLAGAPLILCPPVFYDALVYHLGCRGPGLRTAASTRRPTTSSATSRSRARRCI